MNRLTIRPNQSVPVKFLGIDADESVLLKVPSKELRGHWSGASFPLKGTALSGVFQTSEPDQWYLLGRDKRARLECRVLQEHEIPN